jgi:PAS domain S-box-containing protein
MNNVIYVEDDEEMIDLVKSTFSDTNINVIGSKDRCKAIRTIKEKEISCVISDYIMPKDDLGCFDFYQEVKNIDEMVPFIIFTGRGSEEVASKSLSIGVNDYIQKGDKNCFEDLEKTVQNFVMNYNNELFSSQTDQSPLDIIESVRKGVLVLDKNYDIIYSNKRSNKILDDYSNNSENLKEITKGEPKSFYEKCENVKQDGIKREDIAYNDQIKEWVVFHMELKNDKLVVFYDTLTENTGKNVYRKVTENTQDIITILDKNGIVQYESPSVEKLGYDQTELYGKNIFEKIHKEDKEEVISTFKNLKNNKKDKELSVEYRLENKQGDYIWCESRGEHYNNIEKIGFVISTRIITDRKKRERELKLKKQKLEDLIRVVRHDIPNHLTLIRGASYTIKDKYPAEHERIEKAIERVQNLVKDLNDITIKQDIQEKWVEIEDVISNISVDKDKLESIKNEENFRLEANESKIKKLFENLIWNSIQHNPNKVKIRIGLLDDNKGFFIEDNGKGIDESKHKEVFRMGYSTKPESSGMGLSFVENICEEHNWTCEIKESEKGGARFEFENVKTTKNI